MNTNNFENDRQLSDPTQQQIRERAAAVRKRWSREVKERRRVTPVASWRPPLVMTVELVREINARNESFHSIQGA